MKRAMIVVAVIAGLSPLLAETGCKSSKEVASEVAKRDVRSFRASLQRIPGQIDTVMAKLNAVTAGDAKDRAGLLADYSRELQALSRDGAEVAAAKDEAERNVQRYFREWVKESRGIKTEADRKAAYAAIDSGKARTDVAMSYLSNGSRDFRALLDRLNSLQKSLAQDLSPASVRSVGDQYGAVNDLAIKVKGYIARLEEQIDATLAGR